MNVTAQHVPREDTEVLFPDALFDGLFAIVRDPMERLKSEFRWRASKTPQKRTVLGIGRRRYIRAGARRCTIDFDTWAQRVLDAARDDPSVHDNHLRPQVDYVGGNERLFALEQGLRPVFRWIDEITQTPAEPADLWAKRSERTEIPVSRATRSRIEAFYRQDYELHAQVLMNAASG